MMKLLKKRMPSLIMVSFVMFFMVFSLYSMSPTTPTPIAKEKDNKNNNNNNNPNPASTSFNSVSILEINGTSLYQAGRYYLYRDESINVWVNTSSDVQTAKLYYVDSVNSAVNNTITMTKSGINFSTTVYFPGTQLPGEYNAFITTYNGSTYANYSFYLEISDQDPVIYALYVKDVTWNDNWTRIYEGQELDTYRNTTLDLIATVGNTEGLNLINNVQLDYENGFTGNWAFTNMTAGSSGFYNSNAIKNYTSSAIKTSFDATIQNRSRWMPGATYSVNITAYDNLNNNWIFPFTIKILDRAPEITSFSVSPYNIPNPTGNGTIVTATANATDLEDNGVYTTDPQNVNELVQTISFNCSKNNASWDMPNYQPVPSPYALLSPNDQSYLKMKIQKDGYLAVNFSFGAVYTSHITAAYLNLYYIDNQTTTLHLYLFNYKTSTWDNQGILANTPATKWQSDQFSISNLNNYCNESTGYILQAKIEETTNTSNSIFEMDCANVSYVVNMRVSSPEVLLGVYNPLSQNGQWIDITQFWNTAWAPGNQWSYQYNISTIANYRGTWTFVIEVFDYGYSSYIDPINLGSTTFPSGSQSYATASYLVNWGVPRTATNALTGSGFNIAEGQNPDAGKNLHLTLNVTDDTSGNYRNVYVNSSNDPRVLGFQDGNNIPTYSSYYGNVASSQFMNGTIIGNMNSNNNNKSCVVDLNPDSGVQSSQSLIFVHHLNDIYWLGKDNITALRFHLNWFFPDASVSYTITQCNVSFFNWYTGNWTSTINGSGSLWKATSSGNSQLCPIPPYQNNSLIYDSSWFNNTSLIKQCVNQNDSNEILVRVVVLASNAGAQAKVYAAVNFESLEVSYKDYFNGIAKIVDSQGYVHEYNLTNTVTGSGYRIWSLTFPASQFISQDYEIMFDIQNGNSSTKLFGGRVASYKTPDFNYYQRPWVCFSELHSWDGNYSIAVKPREITSTFSPGPPTVFRYQDTFKVSGTLSDIDGSSRLSQGNYTKFMIQFRLGGSCLPNNFKTYSLSGGYLIYNQTTGFWNLSVALTNYFSAGRYYYRLYVQTVEGFSYASDWYDLRILNFQPQDFSLVPHTLPAAGQFYRESTLVPITFTAVDLESGANGLTPSVKMNCLDRSGNPYTWNSNITVTSRSSVGTDTYQFSGNFMFGRQIEIGTYYNFYVVVTDNDPVWPQTGEKEYYVVYTILDDAPVASIGLASNRPDNSVYRNNSMTLFWNITDLDDLSYKNFTLSTFNVTYPDGTNVSLSSGDVIYNATTERFEYHNFYTIYDPVGTYGITINYHDPDGKLLTVEQHLNIQILDNLPTLIGLKYVNLNLKTNGTDESAVMDNNYDNTTSFVVYRGYQTIQITAQLTDIEDSYKSSTGYHINNVFFTLTHKQYNIYDPWPNYRGSWDNFTWLSTNSTTHVETWQANITLPTNQYFYAGPCTLNMTMIDHDSGLGFNASAQLDIYNNPPHFVGNIYTILVNSTVSPMYVGLGKDITIDVFAKDNDVGHLGIDLIRIDYQVQTSVMTLYEHQDYQPTDWTHNATTNIYILTLHTDSTNKNIPSNPVSITITGISIQDNDAGHYNNTNKFGACIAQYTIKPGYTMQFYQVSKAPFPYLPIIIIVAAVGAVVFGAWYYRKYFSYRKYMD